MSLIRCSRHSREDLAHWETYRLQDDAWGRTSVFRRRCAEAMDALLEFAAEGPCYAGTSWGKDSTVLAHLVSTAQEEHGVEIPVAWIRAEPITLPESHLVRDEFLARHPLARYRDIVVPCQSWFDDWFERGLAEIHRWSHADRHISGIRATESAGRAKRMRRWGHSTGRSCAPLGYWTAEDVFAYLHVHDLPVHPVYAMSMGGSLDRRRLRVDALGGDTGAGFGRSEWERRYYPEPH